MKHVHPCQERSAAAERSRALEDPALPWLREALDPREIAARIAPLVARSTGQRARVLRLIEAVLVRHKPGRRCVLRYAFETHRRLGVYAKIRARGADLHTQRLLGALRGAGLDHQRERQVGVPLPMGALPELHLTLQQACPGRPASEQLEGAPGRTSMERVAEALFELHGSRVPARRRHTLADELSILETRLVAAAELAPKWRKRIESVLEACQRLAKGMAVREIPGIHRDFHPDQVLLSGSKLTLLDLDLFAAGDPALDVGNFSGHLTELALRCHGDPEHFASQEEAFEERYLALSEGTSRASIRSFRILTLARHIQLSMVIPGRRGASEKLLDYCEARLGVTKRMPHGSATVGERA